MIDVTPNVVNKPDSQCLNQTSFHNITSNNAPSGLRENVITTNTYRFVAKIMVEIWHHYEGERGKVPLGGPYLSIRYVCPLARASHVCQGKEYVERVPL